MRQTLSVVIITLNEEANIRRTLESVRWADEIIIVDSGSTDRTIEIARSYGAKVFIEEWKGFAKQKNSALQNAGGSWVLSLDADEEVEAALAAEIQKVLSADPAAAGFWVARKNYFLGRWMRHGGFYPDPKLRLFRRGAGSFEERLVHEDVHLEGQAPTANLKGHLLHYAYPTLEGYIDHMDRYSSLGAQMMQGKTHRTRFSLLDIWVRPQLTFFYNYVLRLGFLDGREGLLLHSNHSVYVHWKYAKAWQLTRGK